MKNTLKKKLNDWILTHFDKGSHFVITVAGVLWFSFWMTISVLTQVL